MKILTPQAWGTKMLISDKLQVGDARPRPTLCRVRDTKWER